MVSRVAHVGLGIDRQPRLPTRRQDVGRMQVREQQYGSLGRTWPASAQFDACPGQTPVEPGPLVDRRGLLLVLISPPIAHGLERAKWMRGRRLDPQLA